MRAIRCGVALNHYSFFYIVVVLEMVVVVSEF